jgi:hypothetical protein
MPKPNIQKSAPAPANPNQPPARVIDNQPAATVAQALNNSARAINAANKQ